MLYITILLFSIPILYFAIVVLESTVYLGVTEEVAKPILERESGLKCGMDFKIGYSPERINPGDEAHALAKITKIVARMDEETAETLAFSDFCRAELTFITADRRLYERVRD